MLHLQCLGSCRHIWRVFSKKRRIDTRRCCVCIANKIVIGVSARFWVWGCWGLCIFLPLEYTSLCNPRGCIVNYYIVVPLRSAAGFKFRVSKVGAVWWKPRTPKVRKQCLDKEVVLVRECIIFILFYLNSKTNWDCIYIFVSICFSRTQTIKLAVAMLWMTDTEHS